MRLISPHVRVTYNGGDAWSDKVLGWCVYGDGVW
jgi:hypothetical protein